jgi:hypothetical protein
VAVKHVCPKCNGNDVYFNKKQIITGFGGILGNRQREVERPFCRKCDIEAKEIRLHSDGSEMSAEAAEMRKSWGFSMKISLGMAIGVVGIYLWALSRTF